jgi:hypothetical protein
MAQPVLQLLGIIVGTAPRGPSFRDALFFLWLSFTAGMHQTRQGASTGALATEKASVRVTPRVDVIAKRSRAHTGT